MENKNKKKHNQKEEAIRMKNGKFVKKNEYDKIVKESSKKKPPKKKTTTKKVKEKKTSTKIEDTFKMEEETPKKLEVKKKRIETVKETLNKPVFNTVKKEKTEEEKKKKRRLIIILLLLLLFFFFILDIDDLIIGVPTEPKIKIPKDRVYNTKVVQIEEDGYTRKKLAYYLYCIRQDDNIKECEWKKTYTKNVVVSQHGENYVWFKGVTEDGLIGKPSKPVIVVIDNEVSTEIKIEKKVTEDTIKVIVKATDEEEIKKYYYKIEAGEYIESDKNTYTFKELKPDTEYKITIKVKDALGNEKEIEFTVKTNKKQEESEEEKPNTEENTTEKEESKEEQQVDKENQMEENKDKEEIQEIPEISLSKVPIKFKIGESYKLPTSYKFGKSGGTVSCKVGEKEYKNTKELGVGKQVIKCSATSNTGITVKVEKEVEVETETIEETVWDGWIKMNLYFPEGTTNWMWRLGKEEETRTGEEDTGWKEYTGPITVRLTDVENVYIKYTLANGEEVIIPPKGKLVVDINPESYVVEEGKTTKVVIKYTKDAEKKQYRINGGEWQNYSESFMVPNNTRIDARVVKTENTYDEEGNLEESKKVTNYDSVYIRTYVENAEGGSSSGGSSGGSGGSSSGGSGGSSSGGSSIGSAEGGYGSNYVTTPTYIIAGPIITVEPTDITEEVTVSLTTKKTARAIYYKIGNSGSYKKYEEPFTVNKNITVYAYYIEDTNGQNSRTSLRYIDNIKQNNKPYVAINVSTTAQYQTSVDVSLKASDYDTLEYSLDGEIYVPYTTGFTVTRNCTVYAKATNQYGTTYESRSITNIGSAPTPKENLSVSIFTNPSSEEVKGLVNKTTVEIEYDKNAEKKYYKIGNGSYKEYTGPFEVTSNTTVTGYATSSNGSGKESKQIDFLTTGIANPIIRLNTYKSAYSVEVTIDYDKTASVKKYRIGTGDLLDYTGPITIKENEPIYAYSSNELGYESESFYEITNIVEEPKYLLLDQGSYFILKLNYPSSSAESSREYKWTPSGSWKQYNSQGILLIKKEYEDKILSNTTAGVKVKDANGKEVVFNDHYYVVSDITNELMENLFMRWDYAIPSYPVIKLSTTEPTRQLYVSIEYDNYSAVKEYKIQTSDGKTTEWLPYEGKIKIDKNNTIIYARGTSSVEAIGKVGSRKITNIDEEKPTVEARADFETPTRKLTIQIVGTDNLGVQVVGWGVGKKNEDYFKDVASLQENNSTFTVEENGIYTLYVEDKVGNTATKEIEVTNIDKNAPAIDINVLTEKYGIEAEVEIDYGDSTTKQYKIGESGSYKNYTGKLVLKSLEVAQYANSDGTLTLYAKGIDQAGNESEVSEKIYTLDLDIPKTPVINASSGYPILTEYGVKYDDTLSISYDNRNDIINYISMDGENWKEYTGVEHITRGIVYAKSVKKSSGLTVSTRKNVTTPTDALEMAAYDGNTKTYVKTASLKYIYVDNSMHENYIRIKGGATYYNAIFRFYDSENNILKTISKKVASYDLIEQIPKGTIKISYVGNTYDGSNLYNRLYEISIKNSPNIVETKVYPKLTEYGIEQGYSNINIEYFQTGVTRLYKIDNGDWKTYDYRSIRLDLGKTLYAKSIDKYGVETVEESITAILPSNAIDIYAYDGNNSTGFQTGSNSYINVDSTIRGEQARIIGYTNWYSAIYTFYNVNNDIINTITIPNTTHSYNTVINIPIDAVKMSYKGGIQSGGYHNHLYEINVKNSPNIIETKSYPTITSFGIQQAYNSINLVYFKTSVQKLYKIDDGEWKNYKNKTIKLNLGQTIYVKGIDKNGVETSQNSLISTLPSDAIGLNAYDGDNNTYFQTSSLKYIYVDNSMYDKYIRIKGGATFYDAIFRFYDSSDNILKTVSRKVASFDFVEEVPNGTVKISYIGDTYNGSDLYNRLHEISVVDPVEKPTVPDEEQTPEETKEEITIPNFISSPTISVSDNDKYTATKTVSISYPSGYTNQYSYDAENWMTYTGDITVDKETTIFARSISGDEVISSSSYQITKIDNVAPSISLSEVPLQINVGEEYTLPSSYSFNANKTGGSIKCLLDDTTEITSTKDISAGVHNIKCTATTGSGLIETAEINITVIDNITEEENTDVDTDNEEIPNREGEVGNEEEEKTTTESTKENTTTSSE